MCAHICRFCAMMFIIRAKRAKLILSSQAIIKPVRENVEKWRDPWDLRAHVRTCTYPEFEELAEVGLAVKGSLNGRVVPELQSLLALLALEALLVVDFRVCDDLLLCGHGARVFNAVSEL